jgi:tetratricopeptide (TPR) repeat protein
MNNLGTALLALGQRLQELGEPDEATKRLEEAAAAFRGALAERTREREPLNWALTLANLGFALQSIGEQGTGTDQLRETVEAYGTVLPALANTQNAVMIRTKLEAVLQLIRSRSAGHTS